MSIAALDVATESGCEHPGVDPLLDEHPARSVRGSDGDAAAPGAAGYPPLEEEHGLTPVRTLVPAMPDSGYSVRISRFKLRRCEPGVRHWPSCSRSAGRATLLRYSSHPP